MSSHTLPMGAELIELRLRLYRPGPPPGAVAEYLDALRAVGAPASTPRPTIAHRRRPRRALAAVAAVALFVALVVGLASALGSMGRTAAVERAPATSAPLELPPVPGRPIGTLSGGRATSGEFDAHGAQAVVSVNCVGDGTLSLRIAAEPPTVLTCEIGGPAIAMIASATVLDRFTISITPDGPVRWSLAAGAMRLAGAGPQG